MSKNTNQARESSRCVEPLSFSMGCLGGSEEVSESPSSTSVQTPLSTNSLNRKRVKLRVDRSGARKSWTPLDKDDGKQEFWASIREPYDYIMGTQLISDTEIHPQECENLVGGVMEMDWDTGDVAPNYVWSLSEFLDQYNELYEWLIQVQLKLYSHSNPPDKQTRSAQFDELQRQSYRRKLFVEKGEQVALRYPASEEEIQWRVNYLKNKWDQLQTTLTPVKGRSLVDESEIELDLAHEEDLLRTWLCTMEGQIQPITCTLPRGCSLHALQERYKDNQILLKDIEAHGPILKSVIRQYERSAVPPALSEPDRAAPPGVPLPDSTSTPPSLVCRTRGRKGTGSAVPRRAKALEKRWHQIYLRSLEWHYYLEGAISNFKEQGSSCYSDSEDEPLTKCRRLSASSCSSFVSAQTHQSRRKIGARQHGWSDYEANSSEAGSYIEDDYLHVTHSKSFQRGTLKRKGKTTKSAAKGFTEPEMIDKRVPNGKMDTETTGTVDNVNVNANGDVDQNENIKGTKNHSKKASKSKGSNLLKVDNSSPNCGVFEYKHQDTDSDNNNVETKTEQPKKREIPLRKPRSSANVRRKMVFMDDEEIEQEALQKIIDSAVLDPDWLNSNLTTDSEASVHEDDIVNQTVVMTNGKSDENDNKVESTPNPSVQTVLDKESIHRLIHGAEKLVREPKSEPIVVSPRTLLKPLALKQPTGDSKRKRVKQWLQSQKESTEDIPDCALDSCDASGELTTEESDACVDSSDSENDISSATQKRGSADGLFSSENTPTIEGLPFLSLDKQSSPVKKLMVKNRKSWSASDDFQLSGTAATPTNKPGQASVVPSVLSSTESTAKSIHVSSDETQKRQSFSYSDSPAINDNPVNSSFDSQSASNDASQSPTVSSTTLLNQTQNSTAGVDRGSPSKISTSSVRKRRTKLRRRSNQFLTRRSDSGSDGKSPSTSPPGKSKDASNHVSYSPYHLYSKDLGEAEIGLPGSLNIASTVAHGTFSSPTSPRTGVVSGHLNGTLVSPTLRGSVVSPLPSSQSTNGSPMLTPRSLMRVRGDGQEDVSSLSEQAWDSYQDFKYLSEPYSEDLDQDAARKLMNFGDDYRKYIDSDESSFVGLPPCRRKSPYHRPKLRQFALAPLAYDSDSELDDLHHLIEESLSQLTATEAVIDKFTYQAALVLDLSELLSTGKANLKCLQDVLRHVQNQEPGLKYDVNYVKGLMERWEAVQAKAEERQRQSTQLRQLQKQLKTLRMNMETVFSQCSVLGVQNVMEDPAEISDKVQELQALMDQTESLRSDLSGLNVLIHRFTSEEGSGFDPLKDDVADLYRLWDEMHRRVTSEMTRLSNLQSTWELFDQQKSELANALKEDSDTLNIIRSAIENGKLNDTVTASVQDVAKLLNERRKFPVPPKPKYQSPIPETSISPNENSDRKDSFETLLTTEIREDRLSDSGTSGYESCSSDDLSERERRLASLRHLARQLETNLVPGSKAWNVISKTLTEAEQELKDLQDHCRSLIMKTAESLDPATKQMRFSNASPKRRTWSRDLKAPRSPRLERRSAKSSSSGSPPRREWIWRMVRAALPFQAALLLLVCVGCLLEPYCCDSSNTLNFSVLPQYRSVSGSVPI